GALETASIVAKPHLGPRYIRHYAFRRHEPNLGHEIPEQAATKMCVSKNTAADRARCSGPRFEPGAAVVNRPANEAVDRNCCICLHLALASLPHLSTTTTDHTVSDNAIRHENIGSAT